MIRSLEKIPFFRLLLPLLGGIILQYYFFLHNWAIPIIFLGLIVISLSFFIPLQKQYKIRWLFGVGIYLLLFSFGIISTSLQQHQSAYDLPTEKEQYIGTITDLPQQKDKSVACKVKLNDTNKNIVCYLQPGIRSKMLEVGDEIAFTGKIQRFRHFTDPRDFDYPRYMYNKGFSGSIYLYSDDWETTGKKSVSIYILSQYCRQGILDFYKSLNLTNEEYSLLSALTLGYKDSLSDDIKQSFRVTGTSHVLAVSGMHVGIIYGAIFFIFSLFPRSKKHLKIQQTIIILVLWCYAFITGLSPSVIRAVIMLTIFCISNIYNRRGSTYNTISLAAFLILLINPFYLFDIGFQLSFAAVLSICFFYPILSRLLDVKKKYLKPIWNLFTLSVAAQIGTFPICIHYFGTFPTYFFLSRLSLSFLVYFIQLLYYYFSD